MSEPPPPAKRMKLVRAKSSARLDITPEIATILVGEKETRFIVHRKIIIRTSDSFKKALEGSFAESRGEVKLLDGEAEAFAIYVDWLYSGQIAVARESACFDSNVSSQRTESELQNAQTAIRKEILSATDCLILADLIQDDAFYNDSITCIVQSMTAEKICSSGLAKKLFGKLPASSPALQLVVDIWVWGSNCRWSLETEDECHGPREFWVQVARGMMKKRCTRATCEHTKIKESHGSNPWVTNICQYHKHREGQPKCF